MAILTVGAGRQYTTIGAAIDASQDGDTIQVQAGTYQGLDNMGEIKHSIKLEAVGGRVTLEPDPAQPEVFQSKGMLLVDNPLTTEPSTVEIDGFDFKNATSSYADNAAGIRFQGNTHLILNNDGFFNNDEGILVGNTGGTDSVIINNSEFSSNGWGGQDHNIYIGHINSFTLTNSYIHGVKPDVGDGNEVKSRAENNTIIGNRIYDDNSFASYSIDLSNGGNATIQNNVIEQGPNSENWHIISYAPEGQTNSGTNVDISNNVIVNDQGSGNAVMNRTVVPINFTDNKVYGLTEAQIAEGPLNESGTKFLTTRPTLDTTSPLTDPSTNPPDTTPALSITADQTSKLEGNSGTTPFTFTVTRSGSTAGTSSASYAVSGGTADAADFGGTLPSGTVSFAAGETSKTVTLNVSGDTTVEPDESFNVVLSSPAGATIGTGTASSTILNDDVAAPALSITADQTSKLEGNSGTTPFTFTVTRSGSTAGTSSANYAVSGGTADAADFGGTLPSGTVSFAVGETSKTVTLNVSGDTTVEPDESFNVVLSSPAGATIGTGTASSTILNDDVAAPALSITADQTSKLEGNSGTTPFTFTVTRSGSTAGTSSANYAVSGGTADAADFGGTLPSGTVSFAAGETSKTVTLNVSGNTTVEPDESFNVVLSSPASATIGTGTASSTILNDDVAATALSITADQTSKLEGNSGTTPFTFTVTRSGSTAGTSSASYAVSGGTATRPISAARCRPAR